MGTSESFNGLSGGGDRGGVGGETVVASSLNMSGSSSVVGSAVSPSASVTWISGIWC